LKTPTGLTFKGLFVTSIVLKSELDEVNSSEIKISLPPTIAERAAAKILAVFSASFFLFSILLNFIDIKNLSCKMQTLFSQII
jgi:hypothetical protein